MTGDRHHAGDVHRSPDEPVFVEIRRAEVHWRFEREFLTSNWACLFGRGCKGILAHEAEELDQGCCSLGAHFGEGAGGEAESMQISAMAALLTPDVWQYHDVGTTPWRPDEDEEPVAGHFGDAARTHTRVVDDACVFLNRPGFAGGGGCALHLAAVESGESPIEWKPSVCWQLPLRVDWELADPNEPDGPETATVRRWSRTDWGDHGRTMAWCCTERSEGGEAYSGTEPVVVSMRDELIAVCDSDESLYDDLVERLSDTADDLSSPA